VSACSDLASPVVWTYHYFLPKIPIRNGRNLWLCGRNRRNIILWSLISSCDQVRMVRTLYFFNFDLFLKMLDVWFHLPYFGLVTIGVCPDTRHGISGFRRALTILSESSVPVIFIIQLLYGFRVWMAWSKHAGMLRELRKARETRAEGVFGWPDPNTGFDQSEHALYTCYFIIQYTDLEG
jgi:hypothetical protein